MKIKIRLYSTILELNLSCCELGDPGVEFLMKGQNQRILSSLTSLPNHYCNFKEIAEIII